MECEICCENNTDYTCPRCNYKTCYECLSKCILKDIDTSTPRCPNSKCNYILDVKVIWNCLGNKEFQNKYLRRLSQSKIQYETRLREELMPYCSILIKRAYDDKNPSVYEKYIESCEKFKSGRGITSEL